MLKWLLKNTAEYRFEDIADVRNFERKCREDAALRGYQVSSFNYTEKEIKVEGEVVDSYFICKISTVFNAAKDPEVNVVGVDYDFRDPYEDGLLNPNADQNAE